MLSSITNGNMLYFNISIGDGKPLRNLLTYYNATGADKADLFLQSHPGASSSMFLRARRLTLTAPAAAAPAAAAPLPRTHGHPEARCPPLFCGPGNEGSASPLSLPGCTEEELLLEVFWRCAESLSDHFPSVYKKSKMPTAVVSLFSRLVELKLEATSRHY